MSAEKVSKSAMDKIGEINSLRKAERTHDGSLRQNLEQLLTSVESEEVKEVVDILANNDLLETTIIQEDFCLVKLGRFEGKEIVFSSLDGLGIWNGDDEEFQDIDVKELEIQTCSALEAVINEFIGKLHEMYQIHLQHCAPHLLTVLDYAPKPKAWQD